MTDPTLNGPTFIWPNRWLDRVRLYRARIKEEVFRLNTVSPPPADFVMLDTSRLGRDIGRLGRFLSMFPLGGYEGPSTITLPSFENRMVEVDAIRERWSDTTNPPGTGFADVRFLLGEVNRLRVEAERAHLARIEAQNPGIDMDEVRRRWASSA